jgi:TIR domain
MGERIAIERRQTMSGIFLSYRRDDSSGWAGRLYEHLIQEWGPDEVFMDIDAIAPGEDFRRAIAHTMETCDVVLVVIGPHWVGATDRTGNRRLDDQGDNHRQEVIAALDADVLVVPVLVGGADMPISADLPEPMRALAFRNAAVVEDRRFATDVRTLQISLREYVDERDARRGPDRAAGAAPAGFRRRPRSLQPAPPAAPGVNVSTALAVAGVLLALVWGVFAARSWHGELAGLRIAAAAFAVVVGAAGVWQKRWPWVLAGGLGGLVGLVLWTVQLISTGHSFNDLFSFEKDGTQNLITFVGAAAVAAGGALGVRARSS